MPIVQVDGQRIQFPDDMSQDEIKSILDKQFGAPAAQPAAEPAEEGYFDRFMRRVRESVQKAPELEQMLTSGMSAAQFEQATPAQREAARTESVMSMLTAPVETAVALGPGSVLGLAGQAGGFGVGYGVALSEGLTPGTEQFNRRVFELTQAGAQMAMAPAQPTTRLAQRAVGGIQEALAPLPPTLGMGDILGTTRGAIGSARLRAQAAAPTVPGYGEIPPVAGPPAPPTSVELARMLRRGDEEALAAAATPSAELQAAQARLGTQLGPEFVTERPQFRELARSLETPRNEGVAVRRAAIEDLQGKLTGLAEKYGGTRDLGQIDFETRQQMFSSVKDLERQAQREYGFLNSAVNRQGRSPASNLMTFLEGQIADVGGIANLSPTERRIYNRLQSRTIKTKTGTRTIDPTYGLIDRTRRELTAARYENKGPFKDAESGLISKLEAELAKDQEQAVTNLGNQNALDIYKNARALVATRKGIEDQIVNLFGEQKNRNKIVGQFTGDLVGAVRSMGKGDFDTFEQVVASLPQNMRKRAVTSAIVDSIGKNPDSFINWYEGVNRNSRARILVKKYVEPEFLKDMTAGYKLSRSVEEFYNQVPKDRLRTVVTSGDGVIKTFLMNAGPRIAEYISSGGRRQTGVTNIAISSTMTPKSRKLQLANEFLTSADFGELVKTLNTNNQISGIRKATRTKTFKNYADAIGLPKEINQRELWLLDAIQSGGRMQPEEERPGGQ